jgi:hypothetical protein
VCVCGLGYPAYKRYIVVCGHIFPHYLANGTIFGEKKILDKMSVLIFFTAYD